MYNYIWCDQVYKKKKKKLVQSRLKLISLGLLQRKLTFLEHLYVFQGAKLSKANLKGANLQRAYLRQVNLRDAVSKTDAY